MRLASAKKAAFDEGSLDQYLREISQYPLITREEEVRLAQNIRTGPRNVSTSWCGESPFRRLRRQEVSEPGRQPCRSDQRGQPRPDPRRAQVRRNQGHQVHLLRRLVDPPGDPPGAGGAEPHRAGPAESRGHAAPDRQALIPLLQELGREPTVEEIAEGMDISEEEVAKTLSISQSHLSLDAPLTPGEDNKLLDYLPDTQNPGPDDETFEHALTESIEEVLGSLKEREAKILRLYFGLDGQEPMTLEEIGTCSASPASGSGRSRRRRWRAPPREQGAGAGELPGVSEWCVIRGRRPARAPFCSTAQRPTPSIFRPMATSASFDVSTGADLQEVDNAVNQVSRRSRSATTSRARTATIDLRPRRKTRFSSTADDDYKMKAVVDVLQSEDDEARRAGEESRIGEVQPAGGDKVKLEITPHPEHSTRHREGNREAIKEARTSRKSKRPSRAKVRVTPPRKDELQAAMAVLRSKDFGVELKFGNYRWKVGVITLGCDKKTVDCERFWVTSSAMAPSGLTSKRRRHHRQHLWLHRRGEAGIHRRHAGSAPT